MEEEKIEGREEGGEFISTRETLGPGDFLAILSRLLVLFDLRCAVKPTVDPGWGKTAVVGEVPR